MLPLKTPMNYFWWLSSLLFLWVRTKVVPQDPKQELDLNGKDPICYILRVRSFFDLLVLGHHCRSAGLPLPHFTSSDLKTGASNASYLYLSKMGWIQEQRAGKVPPSPLAKLVARAHGEQDLDVKMVPVSIIWGRNPGKEERSLLKLLFSEDENAGIIQKLLIVMVQGRDAFVNFGKPVSLRQLVDEGLGPDQTAKKLRRVFRIHFKRQRTATLGPYIDQRSRVVRAVMGSPTVRAAIQDEAKKTSTPIVKVEDKARSYVKEIASVRVYSVVRFFDLSLSYLWQRIFDGVDVRNGEKLRDWAENYDLVYVPCHKSHLDYLLGLHILYRLGFMPPYTAAGINLNYWPIGPLLRRAGGFFLRRRFAGNRLYTNVFSEYVHFLLSRGNSVLFFPEGGRSRTGKLLAPKTGMMSMVLQSYLRTNRRRMAIVPMYIGYDRIMEVKSYLRELRGSRKRNESFGQLVKARRVLKVEHGKAYVNFGEPILVDSFLDQYHPDWKEAIGSIDKPNWFQGSVNSLAQECMRRINACSIANSVSMVAFALLSTPQHAMGEEDLLDFLDKMGKIQEDVPYGPHVEFPKDRPEELLKQCERLAPLERFRHPGGDVIHLTDASRNIMSYYRNTALHLFALPSLLAGFFQHNDQLAKSELITGCQELYPFLKAEFFLEDLGDRLPEHVGTLIDAFSSAELLQTSGNSLNRPPVSSKGFTYLCILGRALGQTFERYSIAIALLTQQVDEPCDRSAFEERCQLMTQRIAILNGTGETELKESPSLHSFVDNLRKQGYVDTLEDGRIQATEKITQISQKTLALLSTDVRQSVLRMT